MTQARQIRMLQLLNHVAFVFGIVFAFYSHANLLFYSFITGIVFSVIGINIAYHRYLSHNSFETYNFVEKILLIVGCLCLVGSPLAWAVSHINHHAYADKEGDPYSPNRIPLWDFLMTRFEPIKHQRLGIAKLLRNKNVKFLHDHYLKVIAVYCLLLCLINPLFVIYFWSIPSIIVLYLLLATNIVCHLKGYRNYNTDDRSYNNIIMSILTLGEGWHNNHHANPSRWNQGDKWWELDPTGWMIRLIRR